MKPEKRGVLLWLLLITAVVVVTVVIVLWLDEGPEVQRKSLFVEEGVDINSPDIIEQENFTEIPVYKHLSVSRTSPVVRFGNPDTNNVYFKYKVYVKPDNYDSGMGESDATDSETVLFDDESVIKPGRAFEVNLYEKLEPGDYNIIIEVSTYDMETETQCNGAVQEAVLSVK